MDPNSRVPYQTSCVTYLDYILLLLTYENFPPTSKTGGCCNMLE